MNINQSIEKCINNAYSVRSPYTVRNYKTSLKRLLDYLEAEGIKPGHDISKISIEHFILFPGWLIANGRSLKSMRLYSSATKFYMNWLVIEGLIEQPNYAQGERIKMVYKNMYKKREDKMPYIPDGTAEKLLDTVLEMSTPSPRKERDIALVYLLYYSGSRNNECVSMNISDFDLPARSAIVKGKGDKERFVYYTQQTADYLIDYWNTRNFKAPNTPAFCRHDKGAGKKILRLSTTSVQNIINDVCKVAGVDKDKFSPHKFRHNFATTMLGETENLALVQDLLGHATPETTRIYARIVSDKLREAHREAFGK